MPRKKSYDSPFRKKPRKVTLAQLTVVKMSLAGMHLHLVYHPRADRTALRQDLQRQLTYALNQHEDWIRFEHMKRAMMLHDELRNSGKLHSQAIIAKKLGWPPRYVKKLLSERLRKLLPRI